MALVLADRARNRDPITYGELSRRLGGAVAPESLGKPLGALSKRCHDLGLPAMSSLVVQRESRIPGDGYREVAELYGCSETEVEAWWGFWENQLQACYEADWSPLLRSLGIAANEPEGTHERIRIGEKPTQSLEALIEEALTSSCRGSGGESEAHRQLKTYVCGRPDALGLHSVADMFMERRFVSGDIVDIMFVGADGYAVVEVEIEGERETLEGLFQAVKYRALLEAELTLNRSTKSVEAFLVAYDIPAVVAEAARTLGVKAIKVDRESVAYPVNVEVG